MAEEVNVRRDVVDDFGSEWSRFDQAQLPEQERQDLFNSYFAVFPWDALPSAARGFDLGCGSGRWARQVAPRVGTLHCIDPSDAIDVARRNLASHANVRFHRATVEEFPDEVAEMDFGYSLGVLHHVGDTQSGLNRCVRALKPGAPFLLYLYYALENRPLWYRSLWRASERVRRVVSALSPTAKNAAAETIAATVYFPLSRFAFLVEKLGVDVRNFPLTSYRNLSYYTLRTDALDRFGTKLEQRFTRDQIRALMTNAGLTDIRFHEGLPYWCAVGHKRECAKADVV